MLIANQIWLVRNPVTWLVGNPRFSLVVENRFWLVNGAGPIRPWSDFVGCDHVSHGWEQWGVSRTRLSWPMCWVFEAWLNLAKNVQLCAKFLWIKGVFYRGLCVIIYAGRIVSCLHWYLIRVVGRMTSSEWFSIWETSSNIIYFNDVRQTRQKLLGFYRTEKEFWPDFAHLKHDYTQEFYRSYSSFISKCPRTG